MKDLREVNPIECDVDVLIIDRVGLKRTVLYIMHVKKILIFMHACMHDVNAWVSYFSGCGKWFSVRVWIGRGRSLPSSSSIFGSKWSENIA